MDSHILNEAWGMVLDMVSAQQQDDVFMASEVTAKWVVMIFSTDAYIQLLTGGCCISIKGFLHKAQIVRTSKASHDQALKFTLIGSTVKMVDVEHPIFQGTSDHWL